MARLFQTKICGVTTPDDAQQAASVGADAIGLNFFAQSSRYVDVERAAQIAHAIPAGVQRVGVFVNMPAVQIMQIVKRVELDVVQLHGDEAPSDLLALAGYELIKVFRGSSITLAAVQEYLTICQSLGVKLVGVIIDGATPGQFGGTGHAANWSVAAEYAALADVPPLILAGGLTAENVALAIAQVRPWGVDTASGVESSPGHKDTAKVTQFCAQARTALNAAAGG
jgi:phosphoribosylanthranilate isomerase